MKMSVDGTFGLTWGRFPQNIVRVGCHFVCRKGGGERHIQGFAHLCKTKIIARRIKQTNKFG